MKLQEKSKLSLTPLSLDEAVTDLLKIKPEPKPSKKKTALKKQRKSKEE